MHFEIKFTGNKNIRSLHQKTLEITKDSHLTQNGDCIIGVNAICGCKDIPIKIKEKIKNSNSIIKFSIKVGDQLFQVTGKGNKNLILSHPDDIVLRKSNFICPRTLAIDCDKSSYSIPRKMVQILQNPETVGIFKIEVS